MVFGRSWLAELVIVTQDQDESLSHGAEVMGSSPSWIKTEELLAVFLYCCPDCPCFPSNGIQMDQATRAISAARKKYNHYLSNWSLRIN